jgi:hypothetical protein
LGILAYEVLLEIAGKSCGIHTVAVVLGGLAININITTQTESQDEHTI